MELIKAIFPYANQEIVTLFVSSAFQTQRSSRHSSMARMRNYDTSPDDCIAGPDLAKTDCAVFPHSGKFACGVWHPGASSDSTGTTVYLGRNNAYRSADLFTVTLPTMRPYLTISNDT